MSTKRALLEEFAREASHTRRLLERIPEEHLAWRPHSKSMTLARLAGHVAEIPGWASAMTSAELDLAVGAFYTPFEPSSLRSLLIGFGGYVGDFHQAMMEVTDEDLEGTWTLRRGEQVVTTLSRHDALCTYVLRHVAHHRGQLTVFLRLLDVALPQVYGPTADHQGFTMLETDARRELSLVPEEELQAVA